RDFDDPSEARKFFSKAQELCLAQAQPNVLAVPRQGAKFLVLNPELKQEAQEPLQLVSEVLKVACSKALESFKDQQQGTGFFFWSFKLLVAIKLDADHRA